MNTEKYENIRVKGFNGRWSAIDEYSDGEADYILLTCTTFRGAPNVLCRVTSTNELHIICKTDENKAYTAFENLIGKDLAV